MQKMPVIAVLFSFVSAQAFMPHNKLTTASSKLQERSSNIISIIKYKAATKHGLQLSNEYIQTEAADLLADLLTNITKYSPDVTNTKIKSWLNSLTKKQPTNKDDQIIEDIILTAKSMEELTLSKEQIKKDGQEIINKVKEMYQNFPSRPKNITAMFVIDPWIKRTYPQQTAPQIRRSFFEVKTPAPKNQMLTISMPPKTKVSSTKIVNDFQASAQKEPWKSKDEIIAIANGLEKVLKRDIINNVTHDQIKTLQGESKEYYKLDHLLYRQIIIPANAELYLIADLHGDFGPIKALLTHLESQGLFSPATGILHANVYIAFLGDYIDRGPDSLKNLWYLWQLKKNNPRQIILTRGNHETRIVCTNSENNGFLEDRSIKIQNAFLDAFALLPTINFIDRENRENNRIALVHGGINPNIKKPLIKESEQRAAVKKIDSNTFLWSDMASTCDSKTRKSARGIGLVLGKDDVQEWMKINNVKTIFHGHDQTERSYYDENDEPKSLFRETARLGIGSRWNDSTFVLNVAPNTQHYNKGPMANLYYSDYGTIACIKPKAKDFVPSQPVNTPQFASNTGPQEIATLPDFILEPLYFLPLAPSVIVPQDQVLASRPQNKYQKADNLGKIS